MADPILHIKDCYYFEVPKFLARSHFPGKHFPNFWVRLDDEFQTWEAHRLYDELKGLAEQDDGAGAVPPVDQIISKWHDWQHHDHANHGKPLDVYLEEHAALLNAEFMAWRAKSPNNENEDLDTFLVQGHPKGESFGWFATRLAKKDWAAKWTEAKERAGGDAAVSTYKNDKDIAKWDAKKVEGYNNALHGKILIRQPFGTQKNLYEMESGFGISKFMLIEAFVAFAIVAIFAWLAVKVRSGDRPRGKVWNMLEALLLFIRDQIARPAIDAHDHGDHGHGDHAHGDHGHGEHAHAAHGHAKRPEHEGDKYVPYLWTIFLFILGCNLVGMFPWAGAPGASFGITLSLAAMTFLVGFFSGIRKFGFIGYWKNQVPSMDLPTYMAIPLLPVIFVIEVLGLFIKHGVLGIRLLANIAAGHLVLVSLLGLTFSIGAASNQSLNLIWPFASIVVVLGSAALSCLELFVAFLQAYVFTLLSALFIGAAVHKH